ncbi:SHOCT domain-containing protein [Micromonospora zamorensis]
MRDAGILTEVEFATKKAEILSRLRSRRWVPDDSAPCP